MGTQAGPGAGTKSYSAGPRPWSGRRTAEDAEQHKCAALHTGHLAGAAQIKHPTRASDWLRKDHEPKLSRQGTGRVGFWVYSFRVGRWYQLTLAGHQINSFISSTRRCYYLCHCREEPTAAQGGDINCPELPSGDVAGLMRDCSSAVCFPWAHLGSDSLNPKGGASAGWQMPDKRARCWMVTSCGFLSSGSQLTPVLMLMMLA